MKPSTPNSSFPAANKPIPVGWVFGGLWVLLFALYYPAAKAGFVTDFTGWLNSVENQPFWEYINRTHFSARSLYQFTQFNTFVFYKLFGIHAWLWHLLFITLHVVNACLLFRFISRLLDDVKVAGSNVIAFVGVLFFCVSPYISEVIVWEPSFHFLQGLLLILLVLGWLQGYVHTGAKRYALWAGIIYFLSTFSLEIFYVTPWLVLTLAVFYRFNNTIDKRAFQKILLYFFLPMLALFVFRVLLFRVVYGSWVSRIGSGAVATMHLSDFGKPAKYLFHLLFLGRFFSNDIRQPVYDFCDSVKGIVIFYGAVALTFGYLAARCNSMSGKARAASLLFAWVMITLALLVPLWFSDSMLVIYDRYTYFTGAFLYMLLAILASFISMPFLRTTFIALFALANLRFAIKVSRYWGKSYRVDQALMTTVPDAGNRTVILLNLPECMNGIAMIGSEKESEFKFMHNLLLPDKKITNTVYDVLSYNMQTPDDGAHALVLNDSTVRVTLNQWGTWWWYEGKGGYSYENTDYKLNLIDGGHFYELTLKKPAQDYMLLYEVGDKWKVVDWGKTGVEQD